MMRKLCIVYLISACVGCAAIKNWWRTDPCAQSDIIAGVEIVWRDILDVLEASPRPSVVRETLDVLTDLPNDIQTIVARCAAIRASLQAEKEHKIDAPLRTSDAHTNTTINAQSVLSSVK